MSITEALEDGKTDGKNENEDLKKLAKFYSDKSCKATYVRAIQLHFVAETDGSQWSGNSGGKNGDDD